MAVTGPQGRGLGNRVFITGASSGVGAATALLLSRAGYRVVGTARDPQAARARFASQHGTPPAFDLVAMDLSDPLSPERGYAEATAILGGVDILINNAGSGELGAVEDTDLEAGRRLFEVNFFGAVRLIKLALPGMRQRRQGVIINLGSIVHDLQFPFKAHYCASKSALTSFTLSLRYEVHPHGIRVHLLEPGWIRSEFHNRLATAFKPGSPYVERLKPYLDFSRDHDPKVPDGMAVARVLMSVLENPRSPVRVAVGADAKKYRIVRRFLSNAMLDRLLLWKLSKKGQAL